MAATALTWAKTGTMDTDAYPDQYDKTMDVYRERSDNIPIQGEQFYVRETADIETFKLTTVGNVLDVPWESSDTNPLRFDQPAPGYDKSITIPTYRQAVRISRTLQKVDRSGKIGRQMSGLLNSGKRLLEFKFVDPINNGFATTTGADGSYIFAADHYYEDNKSGQWSNLETAAALTSTTFNTMRQNMRQRKNERGFVSPIMLQDLIVPSALEEKARQISGSDKIPENSLNTKNVWQGVNVKVWDHLTSSTAWFGWGDLPQDEYGLHYVVLTQPTVDRLAYPSADYPDIVAGWRIYMQVEAAASVVKNMHASAGA